MALQLFRKGRDNARGLCPRPGKDVPEPQSWDANADAMPGLSFFATFEDLKLVKGDEYFCIDVDLLEWPLYAVTDDPAKIGGLTGHWTITALDANGKIDWMKLADWASARNGIVVHELTAMLQNAVVIKARV